MNKIAKTNKWMFVLSNGLFFLAVGLASKAADYQHDLKVELEKRINAWSIYIEEHPYLSDLTGNEYYRSIFDLGIPAVPYMIEKIEQGNWALGDGVTIITKKRFEEYERPEFIVNDSKSTAGAVVKWWEKGRKDTLVKFDKLYREKNDFKSKGRSHEVIKKSQEICALGIAALPYLFRNVEQGDLELLEIISKLTNGKVNPKSRIQECISWWQQNKEDWLIPFPNKSPKADAGRSITALAGDVVTLDGSQSSDSDNDELEYRWKQTAGPVVQLSSDTSVKPTFMAPEAAKPTVMPFMLTVDDGSPTKSVHPSCESGRSKPSTVNIKVVPNL
jgi:hypothetical protein